MRLVILACVLLVAPTAEAFANPTDDQLQGKIDPQDDPDFVPVPRRYRVKPGITLRREALDAFLRMARALREARLGRGIGLYVTSATRTYRDQKVIWERKWRQLGRRRAYRRDRRARALAVLRYSSMPGASRHHWGTEIDIAYRRWCGRRCFDNSAFRRGPGARLYRWLVANAPRFGFCQPYRGSPRERARGRYGHGHAEERWHWSYAPLARRYLAAYRARIEALRPRAGDFLGASVARQLHREYVLNVDCP